jgi:hypothetical protein
MVECRITSHKATEDVIGLAQLCSIQMRVNLPDFDDKGGGNADCIG